ncbi:MAG: rhodanese-like domain-containing protein [Phycisphaerales bacterium JB059]
MKRIDAEQVAQLQDQSQSPFIINVLPEEHFERKHIPGSINIPLERDNFVDRVSARVGNRAEPVVVYCANSECDASAKAATKLEGAGFTNVQDFEAGVEGWERNGRQLVGSQAAS